ncbi:UPF0606 protein KIAA1549L [Engraulis encrasicolus]|uniref:UPF0606 protein KIAA1549L n=1 Tax=Engraulis encrasicolus TaxID=184585 RepID=UPI002FD3E195
MSQSGPLDTAMATDGLQLTTVTTTPTSTPLTETTVTTVTTPSRIVLVTALPTTTPPTTTTSTTTTTPAPTTTTTTATTTTTTTTTTTPPPTTVFTTTSTTTTTTTTPPPTTTTTTTSAPTTTRSTTVRSTSGPTSGDAFTEAETIFTSANAPLPCNITERMLVKTVLSIQMNENRLERTTKLNLVKGLSKALQKALNDSGVRVQIEKELTTPSNVTLGYYVASGKTVYIASVVVDALNAYGFDKLLLDVRQQEPAVEGMLVPGDPWMDSPGVHLQLRTVLRFVSSADNIRSCSFSQMMEQRLESALAEAQDKVDNTYGSLTVEIQGVYQAEGSPSVYLIYAVRNGSTLLNGTASSALLTQLTAEVVGYFLLFPPLIIAEPLEYHNLNTSIATREYWVITVIQDVDSSTLEASYQSFSSLMEQRLAELFQVASRHGLRSRRAATIGGYTVQMVNIRRLPGPKNPAEMTYYVQSEGVPISGTTAAKTLNTVDSQTMALTLGYFVQLQADPVVKSLPSNLWIMAVLTPVSLVIVLIIMAVALVCRRNRSVFKTSAFRSFHPRSKTSYRRDGSYHHQPVQGFDYAKKHMGRPGEEAAISVTKETLVLSLPVRDAPLSQAGDRAGRDHQDLTTTSISKRPQSTEMQRRLPSEDGSVSSNESGKLNTGRSSSARRPAASKGSKAETHTRTEHYDSLTGSLRLISIKPMAAPPTFSYSASSNPSQDSVLLNGAPNMGLKQKSDIEHYRNKLRLKAKRKGYSDAGVSTSSSSGGSGHAVYSHRDRDRDRDRERDRDRGRLRRDNGPLDLEDALGPADERNPSTFMKYRRSDSHTREPSYWSRQSLNSPSPVETEMDLLVMRERSRRGIRNSGYDGEPEPFEETDVDRLMSSLGFGGVVGGVGVGGVSVGVGGVGVGGGKGHSDSSTLSSQPSIDEVRQQMHLLLDSAFGLAPSEAPPTPNGHHHHHHHRHLPHHPPPQPPPQHSSYGAHHHHSNPYGDGVTSAPGTMNHPVAPLQRGTSFPEPPEMHQCSLPKPGFRFTQLPDIGLGSPPPLIPPRPGPPPGTSMRRSTPDVSLKPRVSEASELQSQHSGAPYLPLNRAPFPAVTVDQSLTSYSGNPMTAVYAISANRPGYSDYFVVPPSSSYRSPSWMSYPPEPEDLPHQWNDTVKNQCHLETIC